MIGVLATSANADDTITGGSGADFINAREGNDTLIGGAGADNLSGEGGNDLLIAEASDALSEGGDGTDDIVRFSASVGTDLTDSELVNVERVEITTSTAGSYDFSGQTEGLRITGGVAADTIRA
ncbi:MAG: calcium-binding protein, partial [Phycisphaerae bacterium]